MGGYSGWGGNDDEQEQRDGATNLLTFGARSEDAESAPNAESLPGPQPSEGNFSTGEGASGSGMSRASATNRQPTPPTYSPSPLPAAPDRQLGREQDLDQQIGKFGTALSHNDPALKPRWYERLAGGLAGGLIGFKNPGEGVQAGSAIVNKRFNQADAARQTNLAGAEQQMGDLRAQRQDSNQAFEQQMQTHNAGTQDFNAQERSYQDRQKNATNRAKVTEQASKAGLKATTDDEGNITGFDDDPNSSAFQSRKVIDDMRGAQREAAEANAALKLAQNDPNSPAYRLAKQRAATAAGNMSAAQERAKAYMLNATGANFGTDSDGNALPGSTQTAGGTPVGSRFQSQYDKNQGRVAQFNDVLGATDNLEKTARTLVQKRGKGALSDSVIAAGLSEPNGTFGKWLQGQVANGNMTGEQRDYVTNLRAFRENLQALRKSAGGGVSDSQVNRLMEMAPGASTPDIDYLMRQTKQIRQTAGRLSEGIPNVTGGHTVRTGGNAGVPPQSVVDGMKEGQFVHGPGGSYQKKNGKLVKVGQ